MCRFLDRWIVRDVGEMDGLIDVRYRCLDMIEDVSRWKRNRMYGWVGGIQKSCGQLDRVLNRYPTGAFFS